MLEEIVRNNFIDYPKSPSLPNRDISDDILAEIVRSKFIDNPKSPPLPYNFARSKPRLNGQIGVPRIVDKILGTK